KETLGESTLAISILARKEENTTIGASYLEEIASRAYAKCAGSAWEDLKKKINQTPITESHTIVDEVKKTFAFITGLERIDVSLARPLIEGFISSIENHRNLETMAESEVTTHTIETSSASMQLLKVEEDMKTVIAQKRSLDKQLIGVRAQILKLVKTKSRLETSIKESINTIDEKKAEVINLMEIIHSLEATASTGNVDSRALEDCIIAVEKA
ncbi:hypothetical protein, partial [Acinetobacter indicus]|uniref:hypothetical protein n=1 Tax=Acinetobacter indicus TaxID=756892 RepID=UPI0014439EA1